VRLVALGEVEKLSEAKKVALVGRGYASEEVARDAGRRWRGLLERSFALMQVGADFGDRAPGGGVSGEYQQQLEAELGRPVFYDRVQSTAHRDLRTSRSLVWRPRVRRELT
jgi:hypothetical protein